MQNSNPPSTPLRLILTRTISRHSAGEGAEDLQRGPQLTSLESDGEHSGHPGGRRLAILDLESWQGQAGDQSDQERFVNEETLQETRELLCAPSSVLRMQALKPPQGGDAIPCRLQIGLRETTLYEMLSKLTYSSVWQLLQMTFQPHNAKRSNLATTIHQSLQSEHKNSRAPKAKGKGKGKRSF